MTENQKQFLKEYFFKNPDYAGWGNIADMLLEYGNCIVGTRERIWAGGIGNFIKVSNAENAVGCSLYVFDKESFLNSEWFLDVQRQYLDILESKLLEINKQINEIANL